MGINVAVDEQEKNKAKSRETPIASSVSDEELAKLDENQYQAVVEQQLKQAVGEITSGQSQPADPADRERARSWNIASDLVSQCRIVPKPIALIIRAVFGLSGKPREPHYGLFFALDKLLIHASGQKPFLRKGAKGEKPAVMAESLRDAVPTLGTDVAAALCLFYAVCRRLQSTIPESAWRPFLQEAFPRAQSGYLLGSKDRSFGKGRGMIAGFVYYSGLALQLIMASEKQRTDFLSKKKQNTSLLSPNMRTLASQIFRCDPYQTAALMLSMAGVHKDLALAISVYERGETKNEGIVSAESDQQKWLSALYILDALGQDDKMKKVKSFWKDLGYPDEDSQDQFAHDLRQFEHQKMDWLWLTWPSAWLDQIK